MVMVEDHTIEKMHIIFFFPIIRNWINGWATGDRNSKRNEKVCYLKNRASKEPSTRINHSPWGPQRCPQPTITKHHRALVEMLCWDMTATSQSHYSLGSPLFSIYTLLSISYTVSLFFGWSEPFTPLFFYTHLSLHSTSCQNHETLGRMLMVFH